MKDLLKFLDTISPLSVALKEHLASILQTKDFDKKEFLLKKGQVAKQVHFVSKGLLRCFYIENGREVSSWFMKEGDVIFSVESFLTQKLSIENIQALEPCTTHYISYDELMAVYQQFPEFNFIGRVLTEKYYILCEQRMYSLKMQKSADRYKYLLENFPELIQRVQSQYLASYLGITIETLSRIKAKR